MLCNHTLNQSCAVSLSNHSVRFLPFFYYIFFYMSEDQSKMKKPKTEHSCCCPLIIIHNKVVLCGSLGGALYPIDELPIQQLDVFGLLDKPCVNTNRTKWKIQEFRCENDLRRSVIQERVVMQIILSGALQTLMFSEWWFQNTRGQIYLSAAQAWHRKLCCNSVQYVTL